MIKSYIKFFINCFKKSRKKYFLKQNNYALKVLNSIQITKKNIFIEQIRTKLLSDKTKIEINDFGAGSRFNKNNRRKISNIARMSLTKTKYCVFLRKLVEQSNAKKILELGTSFGITTMYLKSASTFPKVISIEGDSEIAKIAQKNFDALNYDIELININFDEYLKRKTIKDETFDLIFIDGNHTKQATIKYFLFLEKKITENGIIVFDDIRWSKGMYEAWLEIIDSQNTGFFLDLFKMGIFFKNKDFKRTYICDILLNQKL